MTPTLILVALGLCFAYQAYRFRKAGMHLFSSTYSVAVALMLAGYIFRWPDAVRLTITCFAIALLLLGAVHMRKHPNADS